MIRTATWRMTQSASEPVTDTTMQDEATHRAKAMAICMAFLACSAVLWGVQKVGWQSMKRLVEAAAVTQDMPLPNGPKPIVWQEGNTLYQAVHEVSVWHPAVHAWEPISPNLTEADTEGAPGKGIDGITAVAHLEGVWLVGSLAGQVTVRHEDGTWKIVHGQLPGRTVTAASIQQSAGGRIAVIGYGGFASATPEQPGHVYLTQDAGANWQDVTRNLPNAPIQALRFLVINHRTWLSAKVNQLWYLRLASGRWTSAPRLRS